MKLTKVNNDIDNWNSIAAHTWDFNKATTRANTGCNANISHTLFMLFLSFKHVYLSIWRECLCNQILNWVQIMYPFG